VIKNFFFFKEKIFLWEWYVVYIYIYIQNFYVDKNFYQMIYQIYKKKKKNIYIY
jgi:hypothetical protein